LNYYGFEVQQCGGQRGESSTVLTGGWEQTALIQAAISRKSASAIKYAAEESKLVVVLL
jgi:hypothetical protein